MPVEFLTDEQAAAYGRYVSPPTRTDLGRFSFLDDHDRKLVGQRRGEHNRLGFALQLVTVRYLGTFLANPLEVPAAVIDFVAEQLGITDTACLAEYGEREKTHLEHAWVLTAAAQAPGMKTSRMMETWLGSGYDQGRERSRRMSITRYTISVSPAMP